jgi:predicted MFS family arabinose efflux permease
MVLMSVMLIVLLLIGAYLVCVIPLTLMMGAWRRTRWGARTSSAQTSVEPVSDPEAQMTQRELVFLTAMLIGALLLALVVYAWSPTFVGWVNR